MSIPNTQTIIEGKKSNFTVEQLKNASSKERPFYYPYRPDYSVTSNRVYEKPRHGENILSNSYRPPKLLIYNSGELGELTPAKFKNLADNIMSNYYDYSSDEYEIFSLGDQDWLLKFHDNFETFIIKEGNQNFKTVTENISTYPFIKDDGSEMLSTFRYSNNMYLPLPNKNYYVFRISLENKAKELYNISMDPFTPSLTRTDIFEYREQEVEKPGSIKILGGKKLSAIYKPSSFRNLPGAVIHRKSNKAHQVTKTFTYEDDGLTNFDINCAAQSFETLTTRKVLEPGSKLDNGKIPNLKGITDDEVNGDNFIIESLWTIGSPGAIRPDVKLIHAPKFFRDSNNKIYYRDIDKYYYYYFLGRLCRTEISYNNRESGRKIPMRLQYADKNTYTWVDQTLADLKKIEIDGKIAEVNTFRIRTKQLFLQNNNFYEPLPMDYTDPKFQEFQEAIPRKNPYYIVEPFAEEFTIYSNKPSREVEVNTGEFDPINAILDYIKEEMVNEAFDLILETVLLGQFAEIYAIFTLIIDIKTMLFPETENVFTRFPIMSTIFPSFNFEIKEQGKNSTVVKIDGTGTKGYTLSWDRADVIYNGTDFLSRIVNNFYDGLNKFFDYLLLEMGINMNVIKQKIKDNFYNNLIAEYMDLEEGSEIQEIKIDTKDDRDLISDVNNHDYYISYEPGEKKTITVTCYFDSLEEEYNFIDFVKDDTYNFENQRIVQESFFGPGGKISADLLDHNSLFLGDKTISEILNINLDGNFYKPSPGKKPFRLKRAFPLAINKPSQNPSKFITSYSKNEVNLSPLIGISKKSLKINNIPIYNGIVPKEAFPFIHKGVKYIQYNTIPEMSLPDAFVSVKVRGIDLKVEGPLFSLESLLSENDKIEDQKTEYSYFYKPILTGGLINSPTYRVDRIAASYSMPLDLESAMIVFLHPVKNFDGYEKGYLFAYFSGETRIRKFLYYMSNYPSGTPSDLLGSFNIKYLSDLFGPVSIPLNTEQSDPELYNFNDFDFPSGWTGQGALFRYNPLISRTNEYWSGGTSYKMFIFREEPEINIGSQPLGNKVIKSINLHDSNFYGKIEVPDTKTFFEKIATGLPRFYAQRESYMFSNSNLRIKYRKLGEYYIIKNNLDVIFHAEQKITTTGNKIDMRKIQNSPFTANKTYIVYEGNVKKDLYIDQDGCMDFTVNSYSFIYDFVHYKFEKIASLPATPTHQEFINFNPFQIPDQMIAINLQDGFDNGEYKIYEIISGNTKYEYEYKNGEKIYLNIFLFPFSSGSTLFNLNHINPSSPSIIEEDNVNYDFGWQYTEEIKSSYFTNSESPYYFSTVKGKYNLITETSKVSINEFPIIYKNSQNQLRKVNFNKTDRSIEIRYNPKEQFVPFVYGKEETVIITDLNLGKLYLKKSKYSDYSLIDVSRTKFFAYDSVEYKLIKDDFYEPFEIETHNLVYNSKFPSEHNDLDVYMNNSWVSINTNNIGNNGFIYERVGFNFNLPPDPSYTNEIRLKNTGFYSLSTRSIINIYKDGQPQIVFSDRYFTETDFPFVHNRTKYLNENTRDITEVIDVVLNSKSVFIPEIGQVFMRENFPVIIDNKKYQLKNCFADTIFVPYSPNPNHGEEYTAFSKYLTIPKINSSITEISKITSITVYSITEMMEKTIQLDGAAQFINIFEFPFIYDGKYFYGVVSEPSNEIVLKSFSDSIDPGVNFYYMPEFAFFRKKLPGERVKHSYFPIYSNGIKYSVETQRDIIYVKSYTQQNYVYIGELSEINFTGNYSYFVNGVQMTKFIRIRYGLVDKIYFDNEFIYEDKKYIPVDINKYDEKKQCLRTKIGNVDYCYIDFKNKISYLFNENGTDKATRTNKDGGYLSLSLFPFFCNNILYTLSSDYETAIECYVPSRSDVSLVSFKLKPDETPLSLLSESNIRTNHNNFGLMYKSQFPFYYKGVKYMWQDVDLDENILVVPDDSTEIKLPDFGTNEKILVIQPYPNNIIPPTLTADSVPSPIGTSITTGYRYHYFNTGSNDRAKTTKTNVSGGVIKEISNPPSVNDFPFYYNNKYYFLGKKDINTMGKTPLYAYYLEADDTIFSSNIQGINSSGVSVSLTYADLPLIVGNRFYHKGPNNYFTNSASTYYVRNAVVGRNASRYYVSSTGMENFTPSGNVYTKFYPKEYDIDGGKYFIYPGDVPDNFASLPGNSIIRSMGYYTSGFVNRNLVKNDFVVRGFNPMNESFISGDYACLIREEVKPTTTIYYDMTRIIENANDFTENLKLKHGSVPGHRGGSDDSVYYEGFFYKEKRYLTNAKPQISSLPETNTKIINYCINQTSVFIEEFSESGMLGDIYNLDGWISINYFPFKYSGITYKLRLVAAEARLIKIVSDRMIYNSISTPGPIPGTKYKNSTITSIENICNAIFYSAHIDTNEKVYISRKRTIDNNDITTGSYTKDNIEYTTSGGKLFVGGVPASLGDDGMINGLKFRNKYLSINDVDYAIDSFPIVVGRYQYDLSFVHTPRCVAVNNEIVTNFQLTRTTDYFEEFITEYGTYFKEGVHNSGDIMKPNIPFISERKRIIPLLRHKKYEIPLSRYGFVYEISGTRISGAQVLFSFGNEKIFKEGTKIYKLGGSNTEYDETEICFINADNEIYIDGIGTKPLSEFPININGKKINQIKLQISMTISTFNFKDVDLSNMIYKSSDKCHFIRKSGGEQKVYEYLIGSNPSYAITSPLYTDNNLILPVSFLNQRSLLDGISVGSQIIKGDVLYTKVQNKVIIKINSKTTRISFITGYEINTEFEEVNNSETPLIDKIFYSPSIDTIYTTEMDDIVNTQKLFFIDLTIENFLGHINYNDNELIQVDGILYNSRPLSLGNSNIYNKTEYILSQTEKITSLEITTELTQYINVENLYSIDTNTKLSQTQSWNGNKFIIDGFEITINDTLNFDEVIMDVIRSKKDIELNLGAYVIVDGKIKASEKFYTIGNSKIVDILNRKIYSFNRIDDSFFAYEKIETYYSDTEFNGKTVYYLDGFTGSYTAGKPFIYDKILYSGFINTPVSSSESILPYGDRINFVSITAKYDRIVIFSSNTQKDYEVNSNYIPSEYVPFIYDNVKYLFGYPNFYDSNQTIIISRNELVQEIDLQFITGDIYEQNTHAISTSTGKISVSKFPFINNGILYEFEKLKSSLFTYTKTINLKIKEGNDPRSLLPNTDYYYRDDQRFDLNGELNFPMVINNTLYTLAKIPVENFDYTRVETIHYRANTKWINFDLSVIYQNDTEIEINRGISPNGISTESFVSAGIMYVLIPYIEDSVNETRVIKSNYTSGIHIGFTGDIQLSTGFKKFVETTVSRDLFPFIYNQVEYQIEPLLISSEKVIYGIDIVSISKSPEIVTIFYEDGKTGMAQMNNVSSNLFPFVYSGSKYILSNDRPSYDKIDIIQVSHIDNGPISLEISDSHVYSANGWIPRAQSYGQDLFPLISLNVKYTLAKLLPIDTVISTKTVFVVGDSQNVETDIEETEIETSIGSITVNEGIVDREKFPFVWRNTEYKLLEVFNSNYVIRETKEINYFYAETSVNLGFGQIRVYYGTNNSKILNSNDAPISEFPFIYDNVSYSVKQIENKTREGLEIKTEKLETNRYEYVDYKTIENLTLVIRNNTKFFRIADIYKPAKIITDKEIRIIFL